MACAISKESNPEDFILFYAFLHWKGIKVLMESMPDLGCDQNRKHVLEFSQCPKIINRTPIYLKISIFTCIIAICGILMTMIKILGFFVVRKYILLKRDFICIHNIGVRFLSFQMLCLVNTVVCVSFVYINWQWTDLDVEYVLYQLQQ